MRVLIVKVSSLGDIIHTLPAVTEARRARPELRFDWVVEEAFVEVPSWHPAVERVIPVALRRWRKDVRGTLRRGEIGSFREELKRVHYDLVLDPQGLIKSALISRMAKGLTVGMNNNSSREPLATLFYNRTFSVPRTLHAVDRVRELFSRALSYPLKTHIHGSSLLQASEVDYGLDLSRIGVDQTEAQGRSLVFLHGTTWPTKHWPVPYWRELARLASRESWQVKLPWGNQQELDRARDIARGIDGVQVLDRQSLSGLACHLSQAGGVVAVDTGLGHLAAALEVPAVSVYGPTNPGLSGTFGRYQGRLHSDIYCAPCLSRKCLYEGPEVADTADGQRFAVDPPCFASNPPEVVWSSLQHLMAERQGPLIATTARM